MRMSPLYSLLLALSAVSAQKDPNVAENTSAIVHLFEWKFDDVAAECERFLSPQGYAGVQLSPVNEVIKPNVNDRSWWERYQPISYNIISRSGNEDAFKSMVHRCNNVNVRIYVDVVLNHMTSNWGDALGTGNSRAFTDDSVYPAVPYGPADFHQPTCIIASSDYGNNATAVRDCELSGLHDLNQTSPYVREQIISFLNKLVDAGVAGFRVDAAKHMWPEDLQYIYSQIKDLSTLHGFAPQTRPFIYQEVIDYGSEAVKSGEYSDLGRVTEFNYGTYLGKGFSGDYPISHFHNFGSDWGMLDDGDALVFVDNHDNQRGSGGGGANILTYKQSKLYKMAVSFMLSWPYGYPRVMSSYYFDTHDQGPPQDSDQNILSPTISADGTCGNGWVCEHRWRQIYNMVAFRNVVKGTPVTNWWDNGSQQIAYSRGNLGFVAFNDQYNTDLKQTIQTSLPAGTYCDIISGEKQGSSCTGKSVTVDTDGKAYVEILYSEEDGVLAITVASKL
ncbi:alpha-amylase 1-like [Zootermopsis nevadensis]|uniref:Alpha-amylase n=1 Tax=Zootermopsis nevadensis TaxID=136037 RepID=A0A067QM07_ZOONE|nr:alpha-amylase 1-like [Zootermopsis nevadensis]KDR10404.1 Alpha-amylase 1 [Zootermopsis nevadensis]